MALILFQGIYAFFYTQGVNIQTPIKKVDDLFK